MTTRCCRYTIAPATVAGQPCWLVTTYRIGAHTVSVDEFLDRADALLAANRLNVGLDQWFGSGPVQVRHFW
jgi:hypothetical protein